jgi:hypothetical protein
MTAMTAAHIKVLEQLEKVYEAAREIQSFEPQLAKLLDRFVEGSLAALVDLAPPGPTMH